MVYFVVTVALLALARLPAVLAHARITSNPPIRSPGPAFKAACGQTSFNSVSNDPTGHIEEQEPVNTGCELTLCRGMLFADQPASNVQTVKPLQAMEMLTDCTVPHGGPANVSLVDTTVGGAGKIIGSFLKTFDDFCPTTGPTPADQANLRYTLPDAQTIGTRCQNPGDCVVQLFWATPDFSQNYYYCVDVVMAAAQLTTSSVVVPATTSTPVVDPTPTTSSTVIVPTTSAVSPTTTPVIEPVATSPVAASPSPSKFVTSVVVVSVAADPTGIAAAANVGPQTGAGRRRARILWF